MSYIKIFETEKYNGSYLRTLTISCTHKKINNKNYYECFYNKRSSKLLTPGRKYDGIIGPGEKGYNKRLKFNYESDNELSKEELDKMIYKDVHNYYNKDNNKKWNKFF